MKQLFSLLLNVHVWCKFFGKSFKLCISEFTIIWKIRLIGKSKLPKWDDVAVASLNVVLYDVALLSTFYLLLLFLFAAHLKGVFLCNEEVRNGRRCNIVRHSHLIEEECLANGSCLSIISS